ncbi:MAG TPA: transposase [Pseudoxanthomonas sp.]|nr:transposase [Pseudoxanthomonas sp.]
MLLTQRKPGHQALRRGRTSSTGGIYLITATTFNRRRIFDEWEPASFVAARLDAPMTWAPHARVLCWVLMPDHFHCLIELAHRGRLSTAVGRAKGRIAREFRRRFLSADRVWADAFHDHALRKDEDLLGVARYIVLNPVRAGIVARVRDYPFWNSVWV